MKPKKIPVARKLKPVSAPPDPCDYTAAEEDKEDDEKPAKKASKAAGKKAKACLKLPCAKSAYFIFSAEQRGPLKSVLLFELSVPNFARVSKPVFSHSCLFCRRECGHDIW